MLSRRRQFISWTELRGIVGDALAKSYKCKLSEIWKSNNDVLRQCMKSGLHPDTEKPLTDEDREERPWLFQNVFNLDKPKKVKKEEGLYA